MSGWNTSSAREKDTPPVHPRGQKIDLRLPELMLDEFGVGLYVFQDQYTHLRGHLLPSVVLAIRFASLISLPCCSYVRGMVLLSAVQ